MPAHHHIEALDRKGLREFALVTGAVIAGLFGLFLPWVFDLQWPTWPWVLAAILIFFGLVAPMWLQPVYRLWMKFGLILNKITTPIIMVIVFYLVITPIGLVRRLVSDDPMARKSEAETSYRISSKKALAKNMERPF